MGFKRLFAEPEVDFNGPGAIHLYTDGSCLRNGAPDAACGWAFMCMQIGVDGSKGNSISNKGGWVGGTNNQAEMTAVLEGLRAIGPAGWLLPTTVYSDSSYVIETLKGNYRIGKNQQLWSKLMEEIRNFNNIQYVWVKGHATDPYNLAVDRMANSEASLYDSHRK